MLMCLRACPRASASPSRPPLVRLPARPLASPHGWSKRRAPAQLHTYTPPHPNTPAHPRTEPHTHTHPHLPTHTHKRTNARKFPRHTHTHTHTHTPTHTQKHTHMRTSTQTHTLTHRHRDRQICTYAHMHTCPHAHPPTRARTPPHPSTNVPTHTATQPRALSCSHTFHGCHAAMQPHSHESSHAGSVARSHAHSHGRSHACMDACAHTCTYAHMRARPPARAPAHPPARAPARAGSPPTSRTASTAPPVHDYCALLVLMNNGAFWTYPQCSPIHRASRYTATVGLASPLAINRTCTNHPGAWCHTVGFHPCGGMGAPCQVDLVGIVPVLSNLALIPK